MIYLRPVTSKEKNMSELNHLKTRHLDRVKRNQLNDENSACHILTASSDLGVVRNGGRRGSNFGPAAILSNVFKMASHQTDHQFSIHEVASPIFDQAKETEAILPFIKPNKKIINLGGGHDHIYPFLKALNKSYKKITVINIDAHLDTRIDKTFHSGTPFRQFADEVDGEFHLIQFGIHDFANPDSNYNQLSHGKMDVITFHAIKTSTSGFKASVLPILNQYLPEKYEADHAIVFSLDCDALDSAVMEGVSAVNHHGLPLYIVEEVLDHLVNIHKAKFFGIYEYNPVYDNLSEKGSKAIAQLIYGLVE
jgi:formiminoglutamase